LPAAARENPEQYILGVYTELAPCQGCTPFLERVGVPSDRIACSFEQNFHEARQVRFGKILGLRKFAHNQ
jgi:hypothetical protein